MSHAINNFLKKGKRPYYEIYNISASNLHCNSWLFLHIYYLFAKQLSTWNKNPIYTNTVSE